jgi:hypothetical protein
MSHFVGVVVWPGVCGAADCPAAGCGAGAVSWQAGGATSLKVAGRLAGTSGRPGVAGAIVSESIDCVGRRAQPERLEALAIHHVNPPLEQARDVLLDVQVIEHCHTGGRVKLDHDIDVAVTTLLITRRVMISLLFMSCCASA